MDPLLLKDVAHACWEAIQLAVVDFPHAWVTWSQDATAGAGGRHGHRQNTRYVLVNSTFFSFGYWPTDLIAG